MTADTCVSVIFLMPNSGQTLQVLICKLDTTSRPLDQLDVRLPGKLEFEGGLVLPMMCGVPPTEPRKNTIFPRNHENFSKVSYFICYLYNAFWSFMHRMGGTKCFRTSIFLSNQRKSI